MAQQVRAFGIEGLTKDPVLYDHQVELHGSGRTQKAKEFAAAWNPIGPCLPL